MVHQHFMLIPVMTVAENIVLASEPREGLLLDYGKASERVRDLSERYGLAVDPASAWRTIGVAQQQRVEILKALYRSARLLILDEPTAVLTPQEANELFGVIRSLTRAGHLDHLHHPQARRGARDRRPHHGAAPRQGRRHRAGGGRRPSGSSPS